MGIKVAVIMGGRSAEREISLKTGEQVSEALRKKGYDVVKLDLDEKLPGLLLDEKVEVVFIALHGRYGEDGCLQGMLEVLGIPYVGSGVLASALAMDKVMAKKIFVYEGIPTPRWKSFKLRSAADMPSGLIDVDFPYPVVVKPPKQGSTIGLSVAKNDEELSRAFKEALKFDTEVLVEEYIEGTEVTVGIIGSSGGREPIPLPVLEIVSHTGLYDYRAKYTKGLSEHIIPARIPPEAYEASQKVAVRAFNSLGCRGMARVDIIVSEKEGIPYVLEVNTIPGMTEVSLLPDAARAAGIEFPELVDRLVRLALEGDSFQETSVGKNWDKVGGRE